MTPYHHPVRSLLAVLLMAASAHAFADDRDCASGPLSNAASTDSYSLNSSLNVIGLTADGQLVCFKDKQPAAAKTIGTLGGYTGGDSRLVGIDFRPQDGALYGVGDAGGLYRVDTATAALTSIGQLSVLPDAGATFGVDFNPAANALRIVSSAGQNLRQSFANLGSANPLAATALDSMLGYTANATPGPTALGVLGAAYTNNDLSGTTTATTLFVLDSNLDQISLQSPANSGFLVATGKIGANASEGDLDVYSVLRGNVTVAQRALAALVIGGSAGLYDIDLLTGAASSRGSFNTQVIDIAIPINQF